MNAPERPEQSSAHREERLADPLQTVVRQRDAAEESRDRFAFLAEVSRCLAESLDYETTLTTVANMSLRYLGAWCIVDVRCGNRSSGWRESAGWRSGGRRAVALSRLLDERRRACLVGFRAAGA